MIIIRYFAIAMTISPLFLTACGSDSNETTSTEETVLQEGHFVDSPVSGLTYRSDAVGGLTDTDGGFSYSAGESITFSIGELYFPRVIAADIITPIELSEGSANPEAMSINIAMLLQSLDEDGDTSNGISIPADAALVSVPINFDVSVEEFTANSNVINLVANSGSVTTSLVSPETASDHLLMTLAELGGQDDVEMGEGISGFWSIEGSGDYVLIEDSGAITFYDHVITHDCHSILMGTVTLVEGPLYEVATDDGMSQQLVITRDGDTLNILLVGTLTLETSATSADLQICS